MSSVAVAAVFIFCFLCFRLTVSQTKFTKEPPSTVSAGLGSSAIFSWDFSFGNLGDFEKVVWGQTDKNDRILDNYITIWKSGLAQKNPKLDNSFKSRLSWAGNISQHGGLFDFIFKNVTKSDETRTYGCTAYVSGSDYRSGPIKLAVLIPPTITHRSNKTIDVEEGVNVTLHCDAIGDPTPSVLWVKDGKTLQNGTSTPTLQIPRIELRDAGTYVCTAANQAGSTSYSVQVRVVRYKPYINKTATTDPLIKSWINHTTTLKCAVDANPSANFTWLKHGQPILAGVRFMHGMSTLMLIPKTMGDFGLYSCKAENEKGSMVYNITVERLYSPGPPVINKFTSDVLSVNVSWDAPQDDTDGGIFDYKITILEENYLMTQQHHGIKQTFFSFQNLKQNRSYIVFLQARNIVGYGESANGTVRTLEADPPNPPDIKAISEVLALNITWHSSIEDSKIEILDYRIKVIDSITHRQENEYTGIRNTSLLIENLRRNKTYIVFIQARNEAGYGQFANTSATTLLPGPPDTPFISNISVVGKRCSLHWRTPYNGESPIKIYIVHLWVLITAANGSSHKEHLSSWNTTEMSYALDLDWDRNYSAAISAWNKYGESLGLSLMERQFSTAKEPEEESTTTESSTTVTLPHTTYSPSEESTTAESSTAVTLRHTTYFQSEGLSSSTVVSQTELPVITQELKGSSAERKSEKDTFAYLLPLWIILLAFAVPIIFFLSWKASKKITRCRGLKVTDFDGDCEQGNAFSLSKMEKLKERRISKHYETLIEDLEGHRNHGHCMEDESVIDNGNPVTDHQQIPGSIGTCDQTYEKPDSPGSKQDSIDLTKDDAKPFENFQMALK
nr:neural cell adhesion molecule 1-B-like isoform X2 [Pocillopora verrucosa]